MGQPTMSQSGGGQGKGAPSGIATNSTNGSSSVGGSPGGKGNITYPGQSGQPAMGQASQQMNQTMAIRNPNVEQQNNPPNQYQNTIQPWNVSGMTGQNTNNFQAGKGKGR
jgi:hypothetical protein